jgi:hypothetical protein
MMSWDARRSVENVCAPDHLPGAALLDAVRSNGWSQLCFRGYSRNAAEVAAERIAAMIRPYEEKGFQCRLRRWRIRAALFAKNPTISRRPWPADPRHQRRNAPPKSKRC